MGMPCCRLCGFAASAGLFRIGHELVAVLANVFRAHRHCGDGGARQAWLAHGSCDNGLVFRHCRFCRASHERRISAVGIACSLVADALAVASVVSSVSYRRLGAKDVAMGSGSGRSVRGLLSCGIDSVCRTWAGVFGRGHASFGQNDRVFLSVRLVRKPKQRSTGRLLRHGSGAVYRAVCPLAAAGQVFASAPSLFRGSPFILNCESAKFSFVKRTKDGGRLHKTLRNRYPLR